MKKLGIFLIALATTSSALANSCCDQRPSNCFNGYVDFLWWDGCGDQLDYGVLTSGTVVLGSPDVQTVTEKMFAFGPEYSPGVRIGITKQLDCSPFSWFAEWTWYQTDSKVTTTLSRPQGSDVIYTFGSDFFGGAGSSFLRFDDGSVNANFCFEINRLDVGIASTCCTCDQLVIRPYLAGTFAYTNEDIHLQAEFDNPQFQWENDYRTRTSYCGAGAKIGLAFDWQYNQCFSLYTECALTGLWGKFDFDNKAFESIEGSAVTNSDSTAKFKYDEWCGRFMSQLQIGLRYHKTYCNDRPFYVQLGWEHQTLFNQTNWLLRLTEYSSRGSKPAADLILQGLVARVGVEY